MSRVAKSGRESCRIAAAADPGATLAQGIGGRGLPTNSLVVRG
jgi:hypothetical protein